MTDAGPGRGIPWWAGASALVVVACLVAIAWIDRPVALWARGLDDQTRTLMHHITWFGDSAPYLVPAGLLGLGLAALWHYRPEDFTQYGLGRWLSGCGFVFAAVAGTGLAANLLKIVFARPRPRLFFADGLYGFEFFKLSTSSAWASLPSGHSTTAWTLVVIVHLLTGSGPAVAVTAQAALLISLSRVLLTAHYVSDVIAGAVFGAAMTWLLYRYWVRLWPIEGGGERQRTAST